MTITIYIYFWYTVTVVTVAANAAVPSCHHRRVAVRRAQNCHRWRNARRLRTGPTGGRDRAERRKVSPIVGCLSAGGWKEANDDRVCRRRRRFSVRDGRARNATRLGRAGDTVAAAATAEATEVRSRRNASVNTNDVSANYFEGILRVVPRAGRTGLSPQAPCFRLPVSYGPRVSTNSFFFF